MPNFRLKLLFLFFSILLFSFANAQDTLRFNRSRTEILNKPFGTLLNINAEIIDGDKVNNKFYRGSYVLKIKSIDSILLPIPILMEFRDGSLEFTFPTDDFELYNYLYDADTGHLNSNTIEKIEKKYIGRKFDLVGYESGEYSGTPIGVSHYQAPGSTPFNFRSYFIIISELSNSNWRNLEGSMKKK